MKHNLPLLVCMAFAISLGLAFSMGPLAQAQTFSVIHNFTGGGDGAYPTTGLTMISPGNFYGTTSSGANQWGTVFKLRYVNSGWTVVPLYAFNGLNDGGDDGGGPYTPILTGPDGTLYGATNRGGENCDLIEFGCGTVYSLRPPPTTGRSVVQPWTETQLYRFTGGNDGALPAGGLTLDSAGALYGTALLGGGGGTGCHGSTCGVVYKLTPSNGNWIQSVLYTFTGGSDGGQPSGGVIFDTAGNLYGTAQTGGAYRYGTVFQLTQLDFGWMENTLYAFQYGNDGAVPFAGLVFDQAGDLLGTTTFGGARYGGTVFELTPSSGGWTYAQLYALPGQEVSLCGAFGPLYNATLTVDQAGNLYGTSACAGQYNWGSVFKLTFSNGAWQYTSLHDFSNFADGGYPQSNVVIDSNGNLFGTAAFGGSSGAGVIWEITP